MTFDDIRVDILARLQELSGYHAGITVADTFPLEQKLSLPYLLLTLSHAHNFQHGATQGTVLANLEWIAYAITDGTGDYYDAVRLALDAAVLLHDWQPTRANLSLADVSQASPDEIPRKLEGYQVWNVSFTISAELGERPDDPVITPLVAKVARGGNYTTAPQDEHHEIPPELGSYGGTA